MMRPFATINHLHAHKKLVVAIGFSYRLGIVVWPYYLL